MDLRKRRRFRWFSLDVLVYPALVDLFAASGRCNFTKGLAASRRLDAPIRQCPFGLVCQPESLVAVLDLQLLDRDGLDSILAN